jgi:hypothetical protein
MANVLNYKCKIKIDLNMSKSNEQNSLPVSLRPVEVEPDEPPGVDATRSPRQRLRPLDAVGYGHRYCLGCPPLSSPADAGSAAVGAPPPLGSPSSMVCRRPADNRLGQGGGVWGEGDWESVCRRLGDRGEHGSGTRGDEKGGELWRVSLVRAFLWPRPKSRPITTRPTFLLLPAS